MSKSTKPALRPVPKPVTEEEKNLQVARFLANKRETIFQLVLSQLIRTGASPIPAVDLAIQAADYALVKLYPVENKED